MAHHKRRKAPKQRGAKCKMICKLDKFEQKPTAAVRRRVDGGK